MYEEIARFTFDHEFFSGAGCCEMDTFAMAFSRKTLEALDWKLIRFSGGFSLLWNRERWSKEEIEEHYGNDLLVFYMNPVDSRLFYQVTQGIERIYRYVKNIKHENEHIEIQVESPSFYFFSWLENSKTFTGKNYPADILRCVESLDQLQSLDKIDINEGDKKMDKEVADLFHKARKSATIMFVVPISLLMKGEEKQNSVFQFKSVQFHIKYYLMKLRPSERLSVRFNDMTFLSNVETLDIGRKVQTFTSPNPIAMQQKLDIYPSLVENSNGHENILIDCLPLPRPDNLIKQYDVDNNPITFAESFIN